MNKENSKTIKGIAIVALILHHCFLGSHDTEVLSYGFLNTNIWLHFTDSMRVCVSLFAFISGYGLYEGFKNKSDSDIAWIRRRIAILLKSFIPIFFICLIAGQLIENRAVVKYAVDGRFTAESVLYLIIDMLGLTRWFGTPSIDGAWWYLGALMFYIVLTPILIRGEKYLVPVTLALGIIPAIFFDASALFDWREILLFLPAYLLGMISRKCDLFARIKPEHRGVRMAISLVLIAALTVFYQTTNTWNFYFIDWGILPVIEIIFILDLFESVGWLKTFFGFVGTYATTIYYTHQTVQRTLSPYMYVGGQSAAITFLMFFVASLLTGIIVQKVVNCNIIRKLRH